MLRVVPVSLYNIELVPLKCRHCLFWETKDQKVSAGTFNSFQKELRISEIAASFYEPGRILLDGGKFNAYAQCGPPDFFPRHKEFSMGPASPDAILITCFHLFKCESPEVSRNLLLESMIENFKKSALKRKKGYKAIEAFATDDAGGCYLGPLDAYILQGFKILRQNQEGYLLRLDLDQLMSNMTMEAEIEIESSQGLPSGMILNGRS